MLEAPFLKVIQDMDGLHPAPAEELLVRVVFVHFFFIHEFEALGYDVFYGDLIKFKFAFEVDVGLDDKLVIPDQV